MMVEVVAVGGRRGQVSPMAWVGVAEGSRDEHETTFSSRRVGARRLGLVVFGLRVGPSIGAASTVSAASGWGDGPDAACLCGLGE